MHVSGQHHAPANLSSGKEPTVPIGLGGCVGPRTNLDAVTMRGILSSYRESNPGRPDRSLVTGD